MSCTTLFAISTVIYLFIYLFIYPTRATGQTRYAQLFLCACVFFIDLLFQSRMGENRLNKTNKINELRVCSISRFISTNWSLR